MILGAAGWWAPAAGSGHILLVPSSAALSACSPRAPKLPLREGIDDFWAVSARFGPAEPWRVTVEWDNLCIPTILSFHSHSWCCCFSLGGYVLFHCLCLCSDLAGLSLSGFILSSFTVWAADPALFHASGEFYFPGYNSSYNQSGWDWKGPLEVIWSNPPAHGGQPRATCPEAGPDGFWIPLRLGIP